MTSQLLFGEHYKIIEIQKKWSKIQIAHDKYIGWISNNQVSEIQEDEFERLEKEIPTLTADILDIIEGIFINQLLLEVFYHFLKVIIH